MVLGSLDYLDLTFVDTGCWHFLIHASAWCDEMMYMFGNPCYWVSWKVILWVFLTFWSLNIELDTLYILFTWFIYYISMVFSMTWERCIREYKGAKPIVFITLSYFLVIFVSIIRNVQRDASIKPLKMKIFKAIWNITFSNRHLYFL